jgi:RND family efflux transporter MFP subunit
LPPQGAAPRVAKRPAVRLVRAEPYEHRPSWEVRGVLEPERSARAAFVLGGRLSKVLVERGDVVVEGQPLARLDTAEVGAGVAQARAAVAAASAQVDLAADALRRLERLDAEGAVAGVELAKLRHQHQAALALQAQARAAVQMASVKSGQHVLHAPIAGTVLSVPERVGEIVGPGIPQVEIASLDRLRFRGTLPEAAAGLVRLGQTVTLRRRSGESLAATLTYLSPALAADTHRLPFEAAVEVPAEARAGLANAWVLAVLEAVEAARAARVPSTAVVRGETTTVFAVDAERRVRRREVEVVRSLGDLVVVTGLEPGVEVVDLPPVDLADGAELPR